MASYWVSRVLLEIPSGFLFSRFGYYKPLVAGVMVTIIGNVLTINIRNPVYLVIEQAIMAAEAVKPIQRGAAIGAYRTFIDLGFVFGTIIIDFHNGHVRSKLVLHSFISDTISKCACGDYNNGKIV